MLKVKDLIFDDYEWDEKNPEIVIEKKGILKDACVCGTDEKGNYIFEVNVRLFLDIELAKACECSLDEIELSIYEQKL